MIHHFMLKEAIHSTAMEHAGACDCTVCRAAAGDQDALGEIYMAADYGGLSEDE